MRNQVKKQIPKLQIQQFIRFCIVGGLCTAVDAFLFYIMRNFLAYEIALVIGYLSGLIVNYILTIYWTFQSNPSIKNAIGVISVHLLNLFIIRMGLMHIFVKILLWPDTIAYLPTLCISVIINYMMLKFVIYYVDKK